MDHARVGRQNAGLERDHYGWPAQIRGRVAVGDPRETLAVGSRPGRVVARFSKQPVSLYREVAVVAGGEDHRWVDISARMDKNGRLEWDVPKGTWTVLRFGYVVTPQKLSYGSPGSDRDHGMYVDHFSAEAVDFQVRSFVEPLVRDAGEYAGRSLKYFHCDSWEIDSASWTPKLLEEFRQRRGYDALPYLAALAGKIVINPEVSERFRHDVRRTLADCLNDHHYARLLERCHQLGIGFHSESGGPHLFPVDALSALSRNDFPMGEFSIKAATHRTTEDTRLFIKPAASSAPVRARSSGHGGFHLRRSALGRGSAGAEAHADRAFVEGANRMVLHTFTHSPTEAGKPGYEYLAGTHFNPNITWWKQARVWTDYLARCQYLLTQGLFVADVLYFNGEQIPNFVARKHVNPELGFGYDYDVANAEVVLTRLTVKDGYLTLPDGMRYRVLVLPRQDAISIEVLRKMAELVRAGATLVGPPPVKSVGLRNYVENDRAVQELAGAMWGTGEGERRYGKGRVVWGKSLRDVLRSDSVRPDFAYAGAGANPELDFYPSPRGLDRPLLRLEPVRPLGRDHGHIQGDREEPGALGPRHGASPGAGGVRSPAGSTTLPSVVRRTAPCSWCSVARSGGTMWWRRRARWRR